ncbi:MAG: hypothetical protein Q4C71_02585 [Microbacteriaceae bacterium]|nr:hypothetical protein [Microbacteriaceae bacterium]
MTYQNRVGDIDVSEMLYLCEKVSYDFVFGSMLHDLANSGTPMPRKIWEHGKEYASED